jgi:glucose-induced degradation protein 4
MIKTTCVRDTPCCSTPPTKASVAFHSTNHPLNRQMPSGRKYILLIQPQPGQHQNQTKVCSSCHILLDSAVTASFIHQPDSTIVCGGCRERLLSARDFPTENRTLYLGSEPAPHQVVGSHPTRPERAVDHDADISPSSSQPSPPGFEPSYSRSFASPEGPKHNQQKCDISITETPRYHNTSSAIAVAYTRYYPSSSPDPLIDITRLRVRSQGRHCLYPGASFHGTQKSGRNSYDVNVTIVVRLVVFFVPL